MITLLTLEIDVARQGIITTITVDVGNPEIAQLLGRVTAQALALVPRILNHILKRVSSRT